MAVPAHDTRDFEFARTFELPVRQVVVPPSGEEGEDCYSGKDGTIVNSSTSHLELDGLSSQEASEKVLDWLENEGLGKREVNFAFSLRKKLFVFFVEFL